MDFFLNILLLFFIIWQCCESRQQREYGAPLSNSGHRPTVCCTNPTTSLWALFYKLFLLLSAWRKRHQETVHREHETFTETNTWEIKGRDHGKHTYLHWHKHNIRKYIIHWFPLLPLFIPSHLRVSFSSPLLSHSPAILFSHCNYTNTINAFSSDHCQARPTSMTKLPV